MAAFADWLSHTGLSTYLADILWFVPAVQSVHILAVAVVFTSALFFHLRYAGFIGAAKDLHVDAGRFAPPIWIGLVVLLVTGSLLVVIEPARQLDNLIFWIKMVLVVIAVTLTQLAVRRVTREGAEWVRGALSRALGVCALLAWTVIVVCGRWIAYFETL